MVANTETWRKLKEAFAGALECTADERSAHLDAVCGQDSSLRAELESLLSAYESSTGLSKPPWLEPSLESPLELKAVGPYQLIRKLGEGGMGQVWLAEQTAPVRRQVAVKLIRWSMRDEAVLRRFQAERQSLAIMDHPAIAKVFDAGATTDGQPYFVMEYMPGLAITDSCDQKKLRIRERLELFIEVCEGVQHAHQKAVIHRDLKPSNILVVEIDGNPKPRLIDFGLAKAVTPLEGQSLFTQIGAFVGTPGYMSPEQANPTATDVDTRTDVYSLGVVLYELLTGSLPFETKQKRPLDEMLRQLREEDPPCPSTKVIADSATSATAAANRGTEPKQLLSELHGDLDYITMKAVAREPERRYGTPSELAADVRRYLSHQPVEARPASAGYRMRKYVRRHRLGMVAAGVISALLVSFGVVEAIQLRRTTRERDRANRITDFMTGMFKVSDPSEARGNSITAREVLDKASKDIDTGLARDPELQAQLMDVMGNVYGSLGLYARAQPLLERAIDIQRAALGPKHPETLRTTSNLAWILMRQGRYAQAENQLRETLDIQRRVPGPGHPDTLQTIGYLAATLDDEGRHAEAERLYLEGLDIQRRVHGPEDPETLRLMKGLTATLDYEGRYAEAEKFERELLEVQRRVLGPDHPDTLTLIYRLSWTLMAEGRYAEAEKFERELLEVQRRVLGPEHHDTLRTIFLLSFTLSQERRYAEAERLYREILVVERRVLGPEHPETLRSIDSLAGVLGKEGRYAEAEKLLRRALDVQRRVLGPDNPDVSLSIENLGCLAALQGHTDEALSLVRQAIDHGLSPANDLRIDKDPDFRSLHGDQRFDALVAYAKEHAAAVQKPK